MLTSIADRCLAMSLLEWERFTYSCAVATCTGNLPPQLGELKQLMRLELEINELTGMYLDLESSAPIYVALSRIMPWLMLLLLVFCCRNLLRKYSSTAR